MNSNLTPLPIPAWLADITQESMDSEPFPLREVLSGSLYYPSCGFDGSPVKVVGGRVYSFIYVDYGCTRNQTLEELEHNGFSGYRTLCQRDVRKEELTPNGWTPELPRPSYGNPRNRGDRMKRPFCVWSVLEREEDTAPDHGPKRFSLLYLCADGVAAFQALYIANNARPEVIAIIQPGEGFGGNWTAFGNPDEILARTVMNNPAGQPEYLMYGGYGPARYYDKPCWPWYTQRLSGPGRGLWAKATVMNP